MDQALAYSTLAVTVGLAVLRPRVRPWSFRFSPGSAAVVGVVVLFACGLLTQRSFLRAASVQWRPLLTLTCIMIMTGVVQETGAFARLAARIEARARDRSAAHTFTLVFAMSVAISALLNNDAAILILTPLVIALTQRLYPGRPEMTMAFGFAVFLAPGVAPFVVSNPMNLIVAEFAGLDFNSYAAVMFPIAVVGTALTYAILRLVYRNTLRRVAAASPGTDIVPAHPGEKPAVVLMLAVFSAYPIAAALSIQLWVVAAIGASCALVVSRTYRVASIGVVARHVSLDILLFLWGIFLVVDGLRAVGVVDALATLYSVAPEGSGRELATIGVASAVGSALIDNHPMSFLNMMAIDADRDARPLLAALVGGDIGPRLLPIGSLAGLLWMDLLRRSGVDIGIGRFVRLGTLVLVPTLAVSLFLLWLL